jgi:hypothetical protein
VFCGNFLYLWFFLKSLGIVFAFFCFIIFVAQLHLCFVTMHKLFVLPSHFLLKTLLVCVLCQHSYTVCVFVLQCMCKHYPSYLLALVVWVMVICIFIFIVCISTTLHILIHITLHTSIMCVLMVYFNIFALCYVHFTFDFWWSSFL